MFLDRHGVKGRLAMNVERALISYTLNRQLDAADEATRFKPQFNLCVGQSIHNDKGTKAGASFR